GFWQGLFGVCELPDFSQVAEDKFRNYLEENQVISDLNALTGEDGKLPKCFVGTPSDSSENCKCELKVGAEICGKYIKDPVAFDKCEKCMKNNNEVNKFFYTSLGCVDSSLDGMIAFAFSFGLGLAGTVALFCIIYSAFMMQTSGGNPEKI